MNREAAKQFILSNARPVDLAVYKYFFENGSRESVVDELTKYQNDDGGFGHGLEPDYLNPGSSPIATNDAIITLYRVGALEPDSRIVKETARYLQSGASFDENENRWLFAIESNADYPHAIWWKKEGNGISGFNPSVSLAAFVICYGSRSAVYDEIVRDALAYLEANERLGGDDLKCYLLAYELLKSNGIDDAVNLDGFKALLSARVSAAICRDTDKYGVEYVPMPSDFFTGAYNEFTTPETRPLIEAERRVLGRLQNRDGGFQIYWHWQTPYAEFEKCKSLWRPRLTIDRLLFDCAEL